MADPISQHVDGEMRRVWEEIVRPMSIHGMRQSIKFLYFFAFLVGKKFSLKSYKVNKNIVRSLTSLISGMEKGKIYEEVITVDKSEISKIEEIAKRYNIKLNEFDEPDGKHTSLVLRPITQVAKRQLHADVNAFLQKVSKIPSLKMYSTMGLRDYMKMRLATDEAIKDISKGGMDVMNKFNEHVLSILSIMSSRQHFVTHKEFQSVVDDVSFVYSITSRIQNGEVPGKDISKEEMKKFSASVKNIIVQSNLLNHNKKAEVDQLQKLSPENKLKKLQESAYIQSEIPVFEEMIKKFKDGKKIEEISFKKPDDDEKTAKNQVEYLTSIIRNGTDEEERKIAERNLILLLMNEKITQNLKRYKKVLNDLVGLKINNYEIKKVPDVNDDGKLHFVLSNGKTTIKLQPNSNSRTKVIVFERLFKSKNIPAEKVLDDHLKEMAVITRPIEIMFKQFASAAKSAVLQKQQSNNASQEKQSGSSFIGI